MSANSTHPAVLPTDQLLAECEIRRGRRRGPGGQHRNKVETAVVIQHTPTGVKGEATERRSQEQNRRMAILRLRVNLALSVRREVDANKPPSDLWRSRCKSGRIAVSDSHDDFPALLAEALDVISAHEMEMKSAGQSLGCTPSQLTKLLKLESRALQIINDHRRQLELPLLR